MRRRYLLTCSCARTHVLALLCSHSRTGASTQAARHFGVTALRDVTSTELQLRASELEPDTLRRARHVITGPVSPTPASLPEGVWRHLAFDTRAAEDTRVWPDMRVPAKRLTRVCPQKTF